MNIIIFVLVGISLFSLTTFTSYALFTNEAEGSNSINLTVSTAGKVSIRIFAQDTGTEVGTLASHQNIIKFDVKDGFVMESFSCTTGEASYNKATNVLTINNATKSGTCEINYVAGYRKLYDLILSEDLTKTNDGLAVTNETNSKKASFYYKGQVNNNYVSFANQLWRIVRTNEDGSIRLIMQNGIGNAGYQFNLTHDQYQYMYYSNTNVEGGAKKNLEDWYQNNLSLYDSKLVVSEYCEQAKIRFSSDFVAGGATSEMTLTSNSYTKDLRCATDANGKGILNLKIGLLTLDEAMFAGLPFAGFGDNNPNVYLVIKTNTWLMSPTGYIAISNFTSDAIIRPEGYLANLGVHATYSVLRPVISLNKDVLVSSGMGTSDKPYVILN